MLKCVFTCGSVLFFRYFYRACQGTLFPNPVQVGRQLDKLPGETRRNIFSLSRVTTGSPLSPKPPFQSHVKTSPQNCNHKDKKSVINSETSPNCHDDGKSHKKGQTSPLGPADSERGLSDLCTVVSTEADTLPYTKDVPLQSGEAQLPSTKGSDCPDKTLDPSDLSMSSWITSTPTLTQTDSVQLTLPPTGGSQCVKYSRNSEERPACDHTFHPPQRTEQVVAVQSLHTAL